MQISYQTRQIYFGKSDYLVSIYLIWSLTTQWLVEVESPHGEWTALVQPAASVIPPRRSATAEMRVEGSESPGYAIQCGL